MGHHFIFMDRRLQGTLPKRLKSSTAILDNGTPIAGAFGHLTGLAMGRGTIDSLIILCHGLGSGIDNENDFWWRGGQGLELGQENLTSSNVAAWKQISGLVKNVIVYACGASYTGLRSGTDLLGRSDGASIMSALAKETQANVWAADKIQWYFPYNFNFGKWEGSVSCFMPSGLRIPNVRPQVEITDLTQYTGFDDITERF